MQHLISKTFAAVSNGLTLSFKSALFSEIISNLQLMHIILSTTSFKDQEPLENPDILDSIRRITSASGAFNLFEYSDLPGLAYFALIFFSIYFVLFISLFAITAMQIGKKAEANILISRALSKLSLFHSRVFFFFILYASFGLIRHNTSLCNGDEQSSQYGMVWVVFALFFSIDGLGFALIQEFSLYRINKDKNIYASKNNYIHQIMLIHKLLALVSNFFFQNTLLRAQITSSIHIIFIICGMYFFYTKLPFYDSRILKTVFFMNAMNFSISIISIVLVFGHEFGISRNSLLITGILVMIFHFCLFSKVLQRIKEGRIDSPEKAIHFAILLKESNLGQLSLPLFERKFCTIPISTIGFLVKEGIDINQVKDGVNTREYERSIYKYLIKKLTLILERHPDSNVLMLYMSDIYCNKLGNVLMAANMLEKIKRRNPSFVVRNSVRNAFVHLKQACHEMYGNNDIKPEITAFFAYKSQAEFMRTNVEQETAKHIHLWHELKSKNVSAVKILNLSAAIETIESRILNKYNEYKEASSIKFTPFLLIYAIYLQIIKELPSEAIKVFKTLQTLATAQTALNIFDIHSEKAGLVILSLNKGQIGTIVGGSGSIESLFNIKKSKLIGTTLHNLLPKVIADKYTSILEKCIKGSISSLENFRTYAKAKGGDYFEVDIKFQLYFHDIHGLSLLVIFQKISNSRSIIIVDNQNLIQEYSKDVQEVLNLEEDKQGPLRLQDILAEPGPASTLFGFIPKSYETPSHGALTYRSQLASSPIRGSWFKSAVENSKQQLDETTVFSFSNVKSYNDENPLLNSLYNDFKTRSRSRYVTVISTVPNDSNTGTEIYRSDSMNSRNEECQKFSQWIKLKFYPLGQRDFPLDYNVQIKPFRFEEKIFKIIVLVSTDADLFKLRENSPTLYLKQTVPDSFADDFPDDDEKPDFSDTKYRRRQKAWRLQKKFTLESPAKLPSSHHTRNLSTKLQNMLCAGKEQQQAATMILQRFDQTEDRSSKGFYHHRVIRTIKTLKSIFNAKRMHPLSNYSRLFLYLVMIFLIILADLNFCWSRDSFTQIEYGLKVTDMANQRLTTSVEIWAILLVIYARAIGALPNPELVKIFQQVVYNETLPLVEDNYQLQKYLEATSEMKFIAEAFHQRLELWATEDNVSKSLLNQDSFIATNFLVNQYLDIANSSDVIELAKTQDYLYTMNNTANGYLLSSENLISTTHELLSTIIDKNNSRLVLILYLTDIGFLVLALMLVISVWIIAQSYKRLFIVLNKIPPQYIAQRIEQLESIQPSLKFDIHTRDFANRQIQLINKNIEQVKSSIKHTNQNNKKEDSYWIREIIRHLIKYVGPAILCVLLISGIFVSSVLRTDGAFTALEKVQGQLSVSSDAMYHTNMLSASIYSFTLLQNQSDLSIRDGPPDNQISSSLVIMKDISQRLVQTFSNKDRGFDDPVIESLFKDTVCNFIAMPEQIASNCAISTQGETIGLLALVSNYYELSNSYVNLYQNNATLSYAQQLLVSYAADMDINLPVLTFTFQFLNSYILDNLDIKVQAYRQQEVIQLWSILIVIFGSTALIRTVAIKRILHLDVGRRGILKNIPYYMVQESRFMKSYLMREFSEEIVGIRDIL